MPVHSWEPSGEPSSADIKPHRTYWSVRFISLTRHPDTPDTSTDIRNLVRIEVWRSVGSVAAVAGAVADAETSRWWSACPR